MSAQHSDSDFLKEMADVTPLPAGNLADVRKPREDTPGKSIRRSLAVSDLRPVRNFLTTDHVEMLRSEDVLSYRRPGVQHGVFRKLRLGQYEMEARLDLHKITVEQARKEVFAFIRDCVRYELRTVMILHGKGDRNPDRIATIKSYVNKWLQEFDDVLAFHSAQSRHGGTGAVYVMLRKGEKARQENRERFGGR
ncbi:MAG: DNA endonuclease SmrA [Gammaproteobacteria bacterium]|nr:MAG: DNA endonuclease SmrA [Gammaproteobacteria bacterium]